MPATNLWCAAHTSRSQLQHPYRCRLVFRGADRIHISVDRLRQHLGDMQAHLTAKTHQYAAIVLRHQAESFIAADECGSQIACLQVCDGMHIATRCCPRLHNIDKPMLATLNALPASGAYIPRQPNHLLLTLRLGATS